MGQTAIGKAALVLSVNGTGMRSGLAGAGRDVRKWADDTGRGLSSRMGAAGRAAGRSTGGGLMAGLGAGAARAAGPILAATAGIVGVREALETVDEVARAGAAAKAFGIPAEQFTGIMGLARTTGEQMREFIESMVTMNKLAHEGANGIGTVAPEWFKLLNINAKEFAGLRMDEKFFRIFEAIAAAGPDVDKVRAVMAPFGEDGGKFLFTLTGKAPAELRAMAASFAISTDEVNRATTAQAAMAKGSTALSAGWRGIVIAAAPLIEVVSVGVSRAQPLFTAIGKGISLWLSKTGEAWEITSGIFSRALGWLEPVTDKVGRGIAVVTFVIGEAHAAGVAMYRQLADGVGVVIDQVGGWVTALFAVSDTTMSVEQVVFKFLRVGATGFGYMWDTVKAGAGIVAFVFSNVVDGLARLTDAFKTDIRNILLVASALPEELGGNVFKRLAEQSAGWGGGLRQGAEDMRRWGVAAYATWGNSARDAAQWMDELQERFGRAPAEAAAAAQEGAVAARTAVAAAVTAVKVDNGALLKGSSAEVSMRIKNDFSGSSPQERMLEQQRVANRHLDAIKGGIGDLVDKVGTGGLLAL